MINYETDPRPLSDCLKDFPKLLNGGAIYGARAKAASALRVPDKNLQNWLDGRKCPYEASIRLLMTLIVGR